MRIEILFAEKLAACAEAGGLAHHTLMSENTLPPATVGPVPAWNPDVIFTLLGQPVRRRLLVTLASGGAFAASSMQGGVGRRLDATLKHLTRLQKAGFLVASPDRVDKRRMLYGLAPSVPVIKTATGTAIDFGCCLLVCTGKVQLAGIQTEVEPMGKD